MTAYALRATGEFTGSIQGAATHVSLGERLLNAALEISNRRRQRLALANLDNRLLADVGLDRAQVRREINKSLWER